MAGSDRIYPATVYAVEPGLDVKSRMGMGIVVVGGTLFSLVLTLFIIPAVYVLWSREHKRNEALETAEKAEQKEKLPARNG